MLLQKLNGSNVQWMSKVKLYRNICFDLWSNNNLAARLEQGPDWLFIK